MEVFENRDNADRLNTRKADMSQDVAQLREEKGKCETVILIHDHVAKIIWYMISVL